VLDQVRTLQPGDEAFPEALTRIPRPPGSLRLRGALGAPRARVAIVGARESDEYGRDLARRLARGLARSGLSIVSGGARGIDAEAHEGALEAGGHTVAVLASGVDLPTPRGNRILFDRILEAGGGLLSEYPDGTAPRDFQYVERNRLISGVSDAVVVVRAGRDSGALITARLALLQGKPLLAVPGEVDHPLSEGPLRLLREGARLATGPQDVLECLGLASEQQVELPLGDLAPSSRELLGALTLAPRHLAEVAREARLTTAEALAGLLVLELDGLCEQRPGQRFVKRCAW
jgi:DNA processing protein